MKEQASMYKRLGGLKGQKKAYMYIYICYNCVKIGYYSNKCTIKTKIGKINYEWLKRHIKVPKRGQLY